MLLDEIISLLSSSEGNLTDALLKLKVLMHQIGKKEVAEWINYELNGYPAEAELPKYRRLSAELAANVSNAAWRMTGQPLPTSHLEEKWREILLHSDMHQSLSIIEQLSKGKEIARELPPEFYGMLNQGISNGFRVERAWCSTPVHQVKNIAVQVRSRLLDFMLELKDSYDKSGVGIPAKEALKDVDTEGALRRAMFGNIGDHATIIIGSTIKNRTAFVVEKGNIGSLQSVLTEIGVDSDDIKSLNIAIDEDKNSGKSGFEEGTKAGSWVLRFATSVKDTGLKVGKDIAIATVTQAIKGFYGIH